MLAIRQHRPAVTHSRSLTQHKLARRLSRQHGSSTSPMSVCRATLAVPYGSSNGKRAHGSKQQNEHNTDPVQSFQDLFQQDTRGAAGLKQANAPAEVHMCMVHAVDWGKRLRVVGSPPALGAWDAQQGPDMSWHEGHRWTVDVDLAVGSYEFKYVLVHDSGHIEWEQGSNRVLEVPVSAAEMQVQGQWNQTQDTEVLEVREKPSWTQRRQQQHQQLLLLQEAAGAGADIDTANAAAQAADMLQSMLLLQQQEQQQLDEDMWQEEAGAGEDVDTSKATAEAAGLLQGLLQQQKELLKQQLKQQKDAKQAADSRSSSEAGVDSSTIALAASDSSSSSIAPPAFSAEQDMLVSMLREMKEELNSSIAGVAAAVEDVQDEISNVQQQVAQLTAERILQQQQQQQGQGQGQQGLDAGLLAAGMPGLIHNNSSSSSSLPAGWGGAAPATASAAMEALPSFLPAGDLSPSSAASLSGLQTAVLSWRQEVLTFRQESMLMRTEIHGLKDGMDDIEQQLQANTAAIRELQQVVMEQEAYDRARAARFSSSSSRAAAPGAATADADGSGSSSKRAAGEGGDLAGGTAGEQHRAAAGTAGDGIEDLLVSQFHQLAAELTAEVKHAVQAEVAAAQQHQALPLDDLVSQVWTRPPEQILEQILHRQQQQAQQGAGQREATAAVEELLCSHNAQQYHKGLLLCCMKAAGVWEEGLMDEIKGEAMRMTWHSYKSCWSHDAINAWKEQLTSQQQLLAALAGSSADELAVHVLWSLQELSTHSSKVARLLARVTSDDEATVMQQLRPGTRCPGSSQLLQRWMAAAVR